MKQRIFAWLLCAALLQGCSATVAHLPASDSGTDIRYYQNSPYLLVYSNSKGGLRWQIEYLPDQTKMMMASPEVVGGLSQMTLYFQNGVLTGSSEVEDTTQIPKALIAAVQSAIPLLAQSALETNSKVPAPYLFKIVVKGGTVHFIGGQGDSGIQVPLQQGAAK